MRRLLIALIVCAGIAPSLSATPVISYTLASLGANLYEYTYQITGLTLLTNQELDLVFGPSMYGTISNGTAPAGFDVALFQPNSPAGANGLFSLLALTNNPSFAGTFSVDFTWSLPGILPGAQPWEIFDDNSVPLQLIGSGTTVSTVVPTPEPSTWGMTFLSILCAGLIRRRYRRRPVSGTT